MGEHEWTVGSELNTSPKASKWQVATLLNFNLSAGAAVHADGAPRLPLLQCEDQYRSKWLLTYTSQVTYVHCVHGSSTQGASKPRTKWSLLHLRRRRCRRPGSRCPCSSSPSRSLPSCCCSPSSSSSRTPPSASSSALSSRGCLRRAMRRAPVVVVPTSVSPWTRPCKSSMPRCRRHLRGAMQRAPVLVRALVSQRTGPCRHSMPSRLRHRRRRRGRLLLLLLRAAERRRPQRETRASSSSCSGRHRRRGNSQRARTSSSRHHAPTASS